MTTCRGTNPNRRRGDRGDSGTGCIYIDIGVGPATGGTFVGSRIESELSCGYWSVVGFLGEGNTTLARA